MTHPSPFRAPFPKQPAHAEESGSRPVSVPQTAGREPQPEPLHPFKPMGAHMQALLAKVKP